MLTTEHPALDTRIFFKESRSLATAGYQVTNLVPLRDGALVAKGGAHHNVTRLETDGITTIGFSLRHRSTARLRAVFRWLKLISGGRSDYLHPYADLIERGATLQADVYHCHEIDALCAGLAIRDLLRLRGREPHLIYDVHEFTPAGCENVRRSFLRKPYRRLIMRFERRALEQVSYTITTNRLQQGYLLSLNPFAPVEVVYNCTDVSLFPPRRVNRGYDDTTTLCYVGSLKFYRGLKEMVETVRILRNSFSKCVRLLILSDLGDVEKNYIEEVTARHALDGAISCTGWLPYSEVISALSSADIAITFPLPTENNMICTPNKLFDYLSSGLPVVTTDVPGISHIVRELDCGVVVPTHRPEDLAQAVRDLMEDKARMEKLGANGRVAAEKIYNWSNMERRLVGVYQRLFPPSGGAQGPAANRGGRPIL